MIQASHLSKQFGEFIAVKDVSLQVRPGEVLALLGRNGAGKTTTVRMLTGTLRPTSGQARVAGYDVVKEADQVRSSVGVLTEHHGLYHRMRAREYLEFFGALYGMPPERTVRRGSELMARLGLAENGRRLGEYSKGMRQKLALVRAMLHDPPVLLLDEPTSAMDPESAHLVRECLAGLRGLERTIILCTHNLSEAELLSDRIAIIRQGETIASGTTAELKERLLGERAFEVRTSGPLAGADARLVELVTVMASGEDWLRYTTREPGRDNPLVLHRLAEGGANVLTLSEVSRGLEEVYLQVMAGSPGEGVNGG